MQVSRWVVLSALMGVAIGWTSASGAPIGMPAGSTVWMKFEGNACPDADQDDCAGSNQAGPNPPNGIPMSTFSSGTGSITGFAEILPDRIRTLNRGNPVNGVHGGGSGFMHASFEDTYTIGGIAPPIPFDISVSGHVTGVARSNGGNCPSPICNQLVVASAQAEIGVFQTFTDGALSESLRVQPFNSQTSALVSFPTEGAGAPFERPIDITANHTVLNVNVGNTFVLAFGMNSSFGRGEIDLLDGGMISFVLPEGVFLTSALAQTLLPLPGDYNDNGTVDAADYVVWRKNEGTTNTLPNDGGLPGPIDEDHYNLWRTNFGQSPGNGSLSNAAAPEPATLAMLFIGAAAIFSHRHIR